MVVSSREGCIQSDLVLHTTFPAEYKPHGIKMAYDGRPIDLPPEIEEVQNHLICDSFRELGIQSDLVPHTEAVHRPSGEDHSSLRMTTRVSRGFRVVVTHPHHECGFGC
jgi:hypothetical protein